MSMDSHEFCVSAVFFPPFIFLSHVVDTAELR